MEFISNSNFSGSIGIGDSFQIISSVRGGDFINSCNCSSFSDGGVSNVCGSSISNNIYWLYY
jgi:hypothetical protein